MCERSSTPVDRRALLGAGGFLAMATILRPARLRAQGSSPTRIGVIGSGNIGGTIGGLWVKKGHSVFFSSRHPEELKDVIAKLGSLAALDRGDGFLERKGGSPHTYHYVLRERPSAPGDG